MQENPRPLTADWGTAHARFQAAVKPDETYLIWSNRFNLCRSNYFGSSFVKINNYFSPWRHTNNFIVIKVYLIVQNVNDLFFIHASDVNVSNEANISLKSPIYSFYNNNDNDTDT